MALSERREAIAVRVHDARRGTLAPTLALSTSPSIDGARLGSWPVRWRRQHLVGRSGRAAIREPRAPAVECRGRSEHPRSVSRRGRRRIRQRPVSTTQSLVPASAIPLVAWGAGRGCARAPDPLALAL